MKYTTGLFAAFVTTYLALSPVSASPKKVVKDTPSQVQVDHQQRYLSRVWWRGEAESGGPINQERIRGKYHIGHTLLAGGGEINYRDLSGKLNYNLWGEVGLHITHTLEIAGGVDIHETDELVDQEYVIGIFGKHPHTKWRVLGFQGHHGEYVEGKVTKQVWHGWDLSAIASAKLHDGHASFHHTEIKLKHDADFLHQRVDASLSGSISNDGEYVVMARFGLRHFDQSRMPD
jgi:hypothetical protein